MPQQRNTSHSSVSLWAAQGCATYACGPVDTTSLRLTTTPGWLLTASRATFPCCESRAGQTRGMVHAPRTGGYARILRPRHTGDICNTATRPVSGRCSPEQGCSSRAGQIARAGAPFCTRHFWRHGAEGARPVAQAWGRRDALCRAADFTLRGAVARSCRAPSRSARHTRAVEGHFAGASVGVRAGSYTAARRALGARDERDAEKQCVVAARLGDAQCACRAVFHTSSSAVFRSRAAARRRPAPTGGGARPCRCGLVPRRRRFSSDAAQRPTSERMRAIPWTGVRGLRLSYLAHPRAGTRGRATARVGHRQAGARRFCEVLR